jgi:class 3 adenylate cyclase
MAGGSRRPPADRPPQRPSDADRTGYVGLAVHAAARVCFAAHGGQILVTSAVRSAVGDGGTGGTTLRPLGRWRFRGLPKPIELFQVDSGGGSVSFPPPRGATPADE